MSTEKNYLEAYEKKSGDQVGEEVLQYFTEMFSLEIPLGRMMKMMPGMVKYAAQGKEYRNNLMGFMPQMVPMIKKAIGKEEKEAVTTNR